MYKLQNFKIEGGSLEFFFFILGIPVSPLTHIKKTFNPLYINSYPRDKIFFSPHTKDYM